MTVYSEPETKRNAAIARYVTTNPCASLAEIGRYHGITRQRVFQILQNEGAGPKRDSRLYTRDAAPERHCSVCNVLLTTAPSDLRKRQRNGSKPPKCLACTKAKMVPIVCQNCGDTFEVSEWLMLQQTAKCKAPLKHCPACIHPSCSTCGVPVKGRPQAVWYWRNGKAKGIRCNEHKRRGGPR